jgi:hypothetical protein
MSGGEDNEESKRKYTIEREVNSGWVKKHHGGTAARTVYVKEALLDSGKPASDHETEA